MKSTRFSYFDFVIDYWQIFDERVIREFGTVYAHNKTENQSETLEEHSRRTLEIFIKYLKESSLEPVIDHLFENVYNDLRLEDELELQKFKDILWKVCINSVYHHDLGKVNKEFQISRLENSSILKNFKEFGSKEHSKYGKYFLDLLLTENFSTLEGDGLKCKILYTTFILTSMTTKHHTSLSDVDEMLEKEINEIKNKERWFEWFIDVTNIKNIQLAHILGNCKRYIKLGRVETEIHKDTNLFYLYKLLYSLLIIADYYATHCFEFGTKTEDIDIQTITRSIANEMDKNFYKRDYNRELLNNKEILREIKIEDINNINELRSYLCLRASEKLNNSLDKGYKIFFFNAPTGSGKTNTSIRLALDLVLNSNTNIKRIYYVFPYVNIIEQNYGEISSTLSPNNDFVSKIYSYDEWDFSLEDKKEELEYYINQRFLNYPICIISNTNFFNTFIKNGKKAQYKIANFANSVVVLDEVQALPNDRWEYFIKLLSDLSKNYNIYFILMSATLPDLSKFLTESSRNVIKLIENPEEFQKHRAFERSVVNFIRNGNKEITPLIEKIEEKKKSSNEKLKVLCVVNTVKNSYWLFQNLCREIDDFDIYLLNSTIPSLRRKEIIDTFNKESKELAKNILLVSTQSIESGVDIDCHFGFREIAPLDSIEQIRGRINREGKRRPEESNLYIIDFETARQVYRDDVRMSIQEMLSDEKIIEIINRREYSKFYSRVIDYLHDKEQDLKTIQISFIKTMERLEFKKLANPRNSYIRDENITFFVPNIDIIKEFGENAVTDDEKIYLEKQGLKPFKSLLGKDIWNLYKDIVDGRKDAFLESKKLQSVINKFTFSIVNRPIDANTTLKNRVQDDVNTGIFESIGGVIKANPQFIEKIEFSSKTGVDPTNIEGYYKNFDAEFII